MRSRYILSGLTCSIVFQLLSAMDTTNTNSILSASVKITTKPFRYIGIELECLCSLSAGPPPLHVCIACIDPPTSTGSLAILLHHFYSFYVTYRSILDVGSSLVHKLNANNCTACNDSQPNT